MNNFNPRIVFPVILLVMVSGCVGIPNVFGRDVISVQQSVVENGVRDVIAVKDIQTIPKSPLLPNQQLVLSFIVENRDALKSTTSAVDLFNAPTMRSTAGQPCNLYSAPITISGISGGSGCPSGEICSLNQCGSVGGSYADCLVDSTPGVCCKPGVTAPSLQRYCYPDQCGIERGGCKILPGEEKPVSFVMMTPTEADIKNIKTETKLNFKVTYDFSASLSYIVPAVNTDEIIKRQRSGDKTNLFTTKSHSSGPVQIDVELQGAPYILANYEAVLFFKIKNRGSGTLVKSQIDAGAMKILFPPEFDVKPNEKFKCVTAIGSIGTECTNNVADGAIPLYRDESRSSIRFSVRLRDQLLEPFRSYPITADVKYLYELRNSVDLTINPFQNV